MKDAEILERMRNGWELGLSSCGMHSRAWIQKGGLGRGGESATVSRYALRRLRQKGLIVAADMRQGDMFVRRFCLPDQQRRPDGGKA